MKKIIALAALLVSTGLFAASAPALKFQPQSWTLKTLEDEVTIINQSMRIVPVFIAVKSSEFGAPFNGIIIKNCGGNPQPIKPNTGIVCNMSPGSAPIILTIDNKIPGAIATGVYEVEYPQ